MRVRTGGISLVSDPRTGGTHLWGPQWTGSSNSLRGDERLGHSRASVTKSEDRLTTARFSFALRAEVFPRVTPLPWKSPFTIPNRRF